MRPLNLKIYIPTRGRPHRQITADQLQEAGIPHVLVCTQGDVTLDDYKARCDLFGKIIVVKAAGLTEKRQRILEMAPEKFCMLDDDLRFYSRSENGAGFISISNMIGKSETARTLRQMFRDIEDALDQHAQVGLVDKFMAQAQPRMYKTSGRYNQVMAYNQKLFKKVRPRFRTITNQEHDFHLQLSAAGLPPYILTEWSKDAPYYAQGGCSIYRTVAVEKRGFEELRKNWPDIVKIVPHAKNISGLAVRFDWKKADNV
jgi:hypothetical protein